MNEKIKEMIRMAAEDGVITETEKALIIKKAKALGEDEDMVELAIEGELGQLKKENTRTKAKGEQCPNCGGIIPAGAAVCPTCGFELRVRDANSNAKKIQEELKSIEEQAQAKIDALPTRRGVTAIKRDALAKKSTLISTFVIPNTKEDLLALMAFSSPKSDPMKDEDTLSDSGTYDNSHSYWTLFNNCIMMAKSNFADDPAFQHFYKEHYAKEKKKKGSERNTKIGVIVIVVLIVFLMIGLPILANIFDW